MKPQFKKILFYKTKLLQFSKNKIQLKVAETIQLKQPESRLETRRQQMLT